MDQERRRVVRFQFIAPVELVDESSGESVTTYVTDLGLHGCAVGVSNPLLQGSAIRLKITTARDLFEARASVVHATSNRVGVWFSDVKPRSLTVLRRWLAAAKFPKAST
jgi:hypothetical protein